jgi:hypothetical protein
VELADVNVTKIRNVIDVFKMKDWHVVDFQGLAMRPEEYRAVSDWCNATYGEDCKTLNSLGRWRNRALDGRVYFRDQADLTVFLLRWS